MIRLQFRTLSLAISLVGSGALAFGQTSGVMTFDGGGDGSSWNQAANWNHVADPDGVPTSGDPPTPPTGQYTANIGQSGVLLDNTMVGQTAFRVRVGVGTPGSLNITGGSLSATDDISVGQTAQGTMTMSGGSVTLGDDFFIDVGDFSSQFTLDGGNLHIVDRLVMDNHGHLQMNGGEIVAEDDFYILGNSSVTVTGGLMATVDKINMGSATPMGPARLKIDGGIVRSDEWTDNPDLDLHDPTRFMSVIEINGSGKLQIRATSFTMTEAQALIADGHLTTSALSPQHLAVQSVIVPEYFGQTDVPFTQIALVPEPQAFALLALSAVGLLGGRRRK